jgi:hypothetical protein
MREAENLIRVVRRSISLTMTEGHLDRVVSLCEVPAAHRNLLESVARVKRGELASLR